MATSNAFSQSVRPEVARPTANFSKNIWGDHFLFYVHDANEVVNVQKQHIKELIDEVKKELLAASNQPLEQLVLIDTLEHLGIAYHYEKEIEEVMKEIHDTYHDLYDEIDLYHTSLLFRLFRQHGFFVSSDIFRKYKDENRCFNEAINEDVKGMLGLYEASHLRLNGENILDEALTFTTARLRFMASTELNNPLAAQLTHALIQPFYKGIPRLESRLYIPIYEQDPSHNKVLLKFAKSDFNLLQSLHKAELRDVNRWWNDGCFATKLPFARERVVESYFWACGVFYQPQYALLRKIVFKSGSAIYIIDDIYDAYGTIEELELFTEAVERWDKDCLNYLPDYMRFAYQTLVLDLFEEFEQDLAREGRSSCVYYAREQLKVFCKSNLREAKWRKEKYIPTYDEYMDCALTTCGYCFMTALSYLGMGKIATRETFQLLSQLPKILRASSTILRLKNDMADYEIDCDRDYISSAVECYMRQYGVAKEYAYKELNKQVDDAWKSIIEEMLKPTIVPMPLLTCILNLTRVVEFLYTGADHFTSVSKALKDTIVMLFIDSILS